MIPFLAIFWLVRAVRALLFWIFLWQLKEYHIGRVRAHLDTWQGRRIFWNPLYGGKLALFFLAFFLPTFTLFLALFLYGAEAVGAAAAWARRRLLKPAFTAKTVLLLSAGLIALLAFLGFVLALQRDFALKAILLFDLLAPFLFSGLVLLLQPLAAWGRARILARAREKRMTLKNLKVVGITGSYGKTTTKEFLAAILSSKFRVAKTAEHQNSEIGIANAILELSPEHEVFVAEMGAYNKMGIALVCRMALPHIAILTGANEQHLATFGSQENLMAAEGGEELVAVLPQAAPVILNKDSRQLREAWEERAKNYDRKYVWCSAAGEAALWTDSVETTKDHIFFRAHSRTGETAEFSLSIPGASNAENLLLAVAAARELGMSLEEIANAAREIPPEAGPMRIHKKRGGGYFADATYSANPDGVRAGLAYLKVWRGKKALVLPSLIELGSASSRIHKELGRAIGEVCDLAILTTRDKLTELREGANEAGMEEDCLVFLNETEAILEKLQFFTEPEDIVLLEGGKDSGVQRRLLGALRSD